jgi:hypothetical protein
MRLEFRHHFDALWSCACPPKKSTVTSDDEHSDLPCQIQKKEFVEYKRLNLLPFGRISRTIRFRAVKNTAIIVCLAPIACYISRMISVGDRVKHFGPRIEILRAGFVARFDSIKMICFGFLENSQHPP